MLAAFGRSLKAGYLRLVQERLQDYCSLLKAVAKALEEQAALDDVDDDDQGH